MQGKIKKPDGLWSLQPCYNHTHVYRQSQTAAHANIRSFSLRSRRTPRDSGRVSESSGIVTKWDCLCACESFQPLSSEHTAVDVSQSLQIDFVVNMLWNHVIISYFLFFNSMKKRLWFRHSGMISLTKIVYVRNKGKWNLITENNVFFFRIPHLVSFAHNMETF